MSAADLILPGFYGKMPSAGDFVTRRLPQDFVQPWDRWMARHLAPLIGSEQWDDGLTLRFASGPAAFGAAAGVVLPSRDRVGRRFPLSFVALLPAAGVLNEIAEEWFASLEATGAEALEGELSPDELDARLLSLPLNHTPDNDNERVDGMVAWTGASDFYDLDISAPEPVLQQLLAMSLEAS